MNRGIKYKIFGLKCHGTDCDGFELLKRASQVKPGIAGIRVYAKPKVVSIDCIQGFTSDFESLEKRGILKVDPDEAEPAAEYDLKVPVSLISSP